jgi:putative ATPase
MDDLFHSSDERESSRGRSKTASAPLAHRMRPESLDEVVGQDHLLGHGKPLRQWIETDRLPSLVFWGPPGCGKTTLAQVIARATHSHFASLSAVLDGVKDIKDVVKKSKFYQDVHQKRTLLFVDEIHRFNKAQQDALLPHVESGVVTLIGATTENPSFELNSALLSRTRVLRLNSLSISALERLIARALEEPDKGLGGTLRLSEEAIAGLAQSVDGDARQALTALENIALSVAAQTPPSSQHPLSLKELIEALASQSLRQPLRYDKSGEEHYNVISAFIKSIRDSDPHAGLYYLARMLEAGEDPLFIARRLIIIASEEVGNADPRALSVAVAVKEAVQFIGMPEARISLAQAVTYLAVAPKSNAAYLGINEAIAEVQKSGALTVPMHLRNAVTSLMKQSGYGKGYQYAHDQKGAEIQQTHLPSQLIGKRYYRPKDSGLEKQILEKLQRLEKNFEKNS